MSIARKILMGSSGGKKSTYVDDVFSTYLYRGTGSPQTITNGIDLAGEGGMTWIKSRNWTRSHNIYDTVRGTNKVIYTESTSVEVTKGPANQDSGIYQFNNNGFNIGAINGVGANGYDYSSWTFRKTPGFFDVVTYTGNNASNHQIAHNLGSVPGCIIIKCLGVADNWAVYHRGMDASSPENYGIWLNTNQTRQSGTGWWNNTAPTATHFTVGSGGYVNENGETFVAYLFAGGESTAATARSVDFDGSGDYLATNTSTDYDLGTGDFTLECWIKPSNDSDWRAIADKRTASNDKFLFYLDASNSTNYRKIKFWSNGSDRITSGDYAIVDNQWNHVAIVRNSANTRIYVNGRPVGSTYSDTTDYDSTALRIGDAYNGGQSLNGAISNFRLVKGTAVYTSPFRPPTEPLTSISGTSLLCCNNSSVTGTTTGTVTAGGNPVASIHSPFDDPEGFQFGKGGDQNLIKCGTYDGVPNTPNIDVEIGWEPQFFMVKSATASSTEWLMWDSMRGIATDGNDERLSPTELSAEYGGQNAIDLTSTGVRIRDNDARVNGGSGQRLVYIAIRRPDGYVGKPVEAGTDVFATDTGNSSSTIPVFDSGFPVDMAFERRPATTENWYTPTRLTGEKYLLTNANNVEASSSSMTWDSNVGWSKDQAPSDYQSWMWKRHAGFDVVTYIGNQNAGRAIPHSLNKVPEMMWLKYRSPSGYAEDWQVYHKGLNGGVDPQDYSIRLDSTNAEYNSVNDWNDTAPTSTHFTIGSDGRNNRDGSTYINMLFASVDGISKCGYYDGTGSAGHVITTGFTPRFLIIKTTNASNGWFVYDSLRGLGAGADPYLQLQNNNPQDTSGADVFATSSTGFTINQNYSSVNASGQKYIYYAHA